MRKAHLLVLSFFLCCFIKNDVYAASVAVTDGEGRARPRKAGVSPPASIIHENKGPASSSDGDARARGPASKAVELEARAKSLLEAVIKATKFIDPLEHPKMLAKIEEPHLVAINDPKTGEGEKYQLIAATFREGMFGNDTVLHRTQAMGWYAKAALAGNKNALYCLGLLMSEDKVQEENGKLLIQEAARLGDHQARIELGLMEGYGDF